MVGYLTGAAWQSASDPSPRRVDFKSYEFVAYQPGTSVYFVRTDVKPVRFVVTAPDSFEVQAVCCGQMMVLSPDGRTLVFQARSQGRFRGLGCADSTDCQK